MTNMFKNIAAWLPQIEVQWLGGLKTIAGRLTFYRGLLTFLMLIPVAYESEPVRALFPSLLSFMAVMGLALAGAAVAEYGVIYPSQIQFQKAQAAKNDRDPIYERTRNIEQRVDEIAERLDEKEVNE